MDGGDMKWYSVWSNGDRYLTDISKYHPFIKRRDMARNRFELTWFVLLTETEVALLEEE